jgi:hypothetical protein
MSMALSRECNVYLNRQSLNAQYALCGFFGMPFFGKTADMPYQSHDAIFNFYTNLLCVNRRLPFEFFEDV